MGRRLKAQTSTEFVLFISVVFLVTLIVLSSILYYLREYTSEKEYNVLKKQAEVIKNELYLASTVENGYLRMFQIKSPQDDIVFNFTQENNSLILTSRRQQFIADLGVKINGTLVMGNNTIRNIEGAVHVN